MGSDAGNDIKKLEVALTTQHTGHGTHAETMQNAECPPRFFLTYRHTEQTAKHMSVCLFVKKYITRLEKSASPRNIIKIDIKILIIILSDRRERFNFHAKRVT